MSAGLLVENLAEVATPLGRSALAGPEQGEVERRSGVEVLCRDGRIAFVGEPGELRRRFGDLAATPRLDGGGGTLIPGLVDCHTHLPWAGSREEELSARLKGKTYLEIAAEGGGILSTMAATRRASEDELTANVLARLDRMLAWGTTTAEAKSGYGLSLTDELKQLRAIRRAGDEHAIDLVPTLMAAHEFPPEYRDDREAYVDLVCREITPAVAEAGLARFADVFCEQGVYTPEQARRVLEAGRDHGLTPRLHADEFADSGGAVLAAELGAASADHVAAAPEEGIAAMAAAGVMAVLLPGVNFYLRKGDWAPARRFLAAGAAVALATDCNPGSSHTESLPFILSLGIFQLGLSIEEALTAVTLNPAACLGLAGEIGSIEEGKRADLVLLAAPNLLHLGYHIGINPVAAVVKGARVVHRAPAPAA